MGWQVLLTFCIPFWHCQPFREIGSLLAQGLLQLVIRPKVRIGFFPSLRSLFRLYFLLLFLPSFLSIPSPPSLSVFSVSESPEEEEKDESEFLN